MKLWDIAPSERAVIVGYDSELDQNSQNRLMDLGFSVGATIECVRRTQFAGPRVFLVNQTLFALEKSVAQQIRVQTSGGAHGGN